MNAAADFESLVLDEVTRGLDPERAREIELLERELGPDAAETREQMHRAALAVELACGYQEAAVPAEVEKRLLDLADRFSSGVVVAHPSSVERLRDRSSGRPRTAIENAEREGPSGSPALWNGLAAAGILLFALAGWWPRLTSSDTPRVEGDADLSPNQLISESALQLTFSATEDPGASGASGSLVWDAQSQHGVMRFVGLPANDPGRFQYQLWIFDRQRDERYPVDGGTFDVSAEGVVEIPIRTQLPVHDPTLFAVTVEDPGGVVVSSREHIVLVAAAG